MNNSKRRKRSRAPLKNRKPAASKKRNKKRNYSQQIKEPVSYVSAYTKLMESVIETIGDQLLNIEIKLAVQQFLINETIDEWKRKGGLSDSEVKSLYERTFQYWKNDLKEQGKPFAELDLVNRPALELYKRKLDELGKVEDAAQPAVKPIVINPKSEEDAEMISQMKEEMKGMKREFLRQKLEAMKRSLKKDTV